MNSETFPKLPLTPGTYPTTWNWNSRSVPGEVVLDSNQTPLARIFDDFEEQHTAELRTYPRERQVPILAGKLRMGYDVVLVQVSLQNADPDYTWGSARYAIAGLGIGASEEPRYPRIRLQITHADLLLGIGPVKSVQAPRAEKGRFAVATNPKATKTWIDTETGTRLSCHYDREWSLNYQHEFRLRFAPVMTFTTTSPLTVPEWFETWLLPLINVTSLAARTRVRVCWLEVHTAVTNGRDDPHKDREAIIFGTGIAQEPYEAHYETDWTLPEGRPLFALNTLRMNFLNVLRHWRALSADDNSFIELYGDTLTGRRLPTRARFLHLIQALEALDSYENRRQEAKEQRNFVALRKRAIKAIAAANLSTDVLKFLEEEWSARKLVSLDERLSRLLAKIPDPLREVLERELARASDQTTVTALRGEPMQAQLRIIRNQLSHGSRKYTNQELEPWTRVAERLCQAHSLRLLGFKSTALQEAFHEETM